MPLHGGVRRVLEGQGPRPAVPRTDPRRGTDGFLLYREGAAVGWCQAARRDELPLLVRGRGRPDPEVWAISCLVLVPEARGQGLSHTFIWLVLSELRGRGVARVEAFACRYGVGEDTSTFVEFPESLCRGAGMTLLEEHPMRPIYGLVLNPPTRPAGS